MSTTDLIWNRTIFLVDGEPEDLKQGFVYIWTSAKLGCHYIGGFCGRQWKYYVGSGKKFKEVIAELGLESFTRFIVYIGENYKDVEDALLKAFDVANEPAFLNISASARGLGLRGEAHPMFGRTHTPETRALLSQARLGQPKSPEHRARIGAAHLGKTLSAEHRAKLSAARRNRVISDATRSKISAAMSGENHPLFGKPRTAEAKARISVAQKARHQARKAAAEQAALVATPVAATIH